MTSLQIPVNSYDTSGTDIEHQIHTMIRSDLEPLGEVVEINGAITPTHQHGIKLGGLFVKVQHPRMRVPIVLNVDWDDTGKGLVYRDRQRASNLVFTPTRVSDYGTGGREEMETELIEKVFRLLDAHPAHLPAHVPSKGANVMTSGLIAVGGPTLISLVDLELFSMPNEVFFPACALAFSAGVGVGIAGLARWMRSTVAVQEHGDQVARWNANLHQTLLDVFSSEQEKVMFMDAFYSRLAAFGWDDVDQLEVTPLPGPGHGSLEAQHPEAFPFHPFLLSFRARRTSFSNSTVIYWDGTTFFARFSGGDSTVGRRPFFVPLSPMPQPGVDSEAPAAAAGDGVDEDRRSGIRRLRKYFSLASQAPPRKESPEDEATPGGFSTEPPEYVTVVSGDGSTRIIKTRTDERRWEV